MRFKAFTNFPIYSRPTWSKVWCEKRRYQSEKLVIWLLTLRKKVNCSIPLLRERTHTIQIRTQQEMR